MPQSRKPSTAIAYVLLLGACAAACATARREPLFAAADLASRDIETVTLAAIVEERAFPETQVPLASYVTHAAEQVLAAKGHDAVAAAPTVVALDVAVLDAEADDLLAATDVPGRHVLWIALERVDTDNTDIGLDTRVRVSGVLLDAERREVIWRDRAERESSISGAGFATISPSVRTYEAVHAAVGTLLASLPDRPR